MVRLSLFYFIILQQTIRMKLRFIDKQMKLISKKNIFIRTTKKNNTDATFVVK